MNDQSHTAGHHFGEHGFRSISWSAIIIGAIVATGLGFLLNLFSIATGLTAFTTTEAGATSLAIGGFLGMLIGTLALMFASGWVSGYLARHRAGDQRFGILYGLATWCLALIISAILASHINQFILSNLHSMFGAGSNLMNVAGNKSAEMLTKAMPSNTDLSTKLGISMFLTFLLFFLGAIACCLGGYCGYKPKDGSRA